MKRLNIRLSWWSLVIFCDFGYTRVPGYFEMTRVLIPQNKIVQVSFYCIFNCFTCEKTLQRNFFSTYYFTVFQKIQSHVGYPVYLSNYIFGKYHIIPSPLHYSLLQWVHYGTFSKRTCRNLILKRKVTYIRILVLVGSIQKRHKISSTYLKFRHVGMV